MVVGLALVRIAIVMAMVALGGAIYGYHAAKEHYYPDKKEDNDKKNR